VAEHRSVFGPQAGGERLAAAGVENGQERSRRKIVRSAAGRSPQRAHAQSGSARAWSRARAGRDADLQAGELPGAGAGAEPFDPPAAAVLRPRTRWTSGRSPGRVLGPSAGRGVVAGLDEAAVRASKADDREAVAVSKARTVMGRRGRRTGRRRSVVPDRPSVARSRSGCPRVPDLRALYGNNSHSGLSRRKARRWRSDPSRLLGSPPFRRSAACQRSST